MASPANDSSRPVLRRTQPKVVPPHSKVVKAPTILKKSPPPKELLEEKKPLLASPRPQLPSVQVPETVKLDNKPPASALSPASVHDLLRLVDEDETSSIASSSSHSSPSFKKVFSCSTPTLRSSSSSNIKQAKKKNNVPAQMISPPIKKIPSPQDLLAQRKMKISHYGRKQGSPKAVKVVPEGLEPPAASSPAKKRCGWICAQSDPAYIAYHDEEWGVPVHDDRMLFELLVLAGAQSEMGWSLILSKRDTYRRAFEGFDIAAVAAFNKKKVAALKAELDIFQQDGKLQAVVDNAGRVLQMVQEFGSLSNYLWGFLNHKPIVTNFRTSAQVPVKSSKSEYISKDLVRRGFSCVGPVTIYSMMQAAGMSNDHTSQCFRHKECSELAMGVKQSLQQQHDISDKCEAGECKQQQHQQQQQLHEVFVPVC